MLCGGFERCIAGDCSCDGSVEIVCTACENGLPVACDECGATGFVTLARCPVALISADVWEVISAARMMELGFLPSVGGWLDQAATGLEAMRLVQLEIDRAGANKIAHTTR